MVKYEIESELAELSNNGSTAKRLTITSWSGYPAKLDLRLWVIEADGERPGKGITLSDEEAKTLLNALQKYFDNRKEL